MRLLALLLVTLAACSNSGAIKSPDTRYYGMLLNARELGAAVVQRLVASDPTIRGFVARAGDPDFVLLANQHDVEFIYVQQSQLIHFHRDQPNSPSVAGFVSPLPSGVNNILPADMRAGTGEPLQLGGASCWTLMVGPDACRTCCRGPQACVSECRAGSS